MMVVQEVERADEIIGVVKIIIDLLFAVPVIPEGQAIHPRIDEITIVRFRESFAMRGILAVGDHEVDPILFNESRQRKMDRIAAHLSDDITDRRECARSTPLFGGFDRAIFTDDGHFNRARIRHGRLNLLTHLLRHLDGIGIADFDPG
jgi:hypothetical protein